MVTGSAIKRVDSETAAPVEIFSKKDILVHADAKERRAERGTGGTRDWTLKDEVCLNPERESPETLKQAA